MLDAHGEIAGAADPAVGGAEVDALYWQADLDLIARAEACTQRKAKE